MLQEYHRQITIKPFAPILKDRNLKRWDSAMSIRTDLSLLSISSSSSSSSDDEGDIEQHARDRESSISCESSSGSETSEEQHSKHVAIDPYLLYKHLNGIPSTVSPPVELTVDSTVKELFDGSTSSFRIQNETYDPRSIRPPPFWKHIEQIKISRAKLAPVLRRSARITVRTTKGEQLKLARQKSASESIQNSIQSRPRSSPRHHLTSLPKLRQISSIFPTSDRSLHSRTRSSSSIYRTESARSCGVALDSLRHLTISPFLAKQMQKDIQSNRVPAYFKPLHSALLREQPHPKLTRQYKIYRIHHWLDHILPNENLEYNEFASIESTIGTNPNDDDDDDNLLSDEKQPPGERTVPEAKRARTLFQSEIEHKMQRHNLLLTRIELDLYVL